jgi:hypothetical protein
MGEGRKRVMGLMPAKARDSATLAPTIGPSPLMGEGRERVKRLIPSTGRDTEACSSDGCILI